MSHLRRDIGPGARQGTVPVARGLSLVPQVQVRPDPGEWNRTMLQSEIEAALEDPNASRRNWRAFPAGGA